MNQPKNIRREGKEKCLVKGTGGFFGNPDRYEHDWAYKNKQHRKCRKCGEKELFWGWTGSYDQIEDWRPEL